MKHVIDGGCPSVKKTATGDRFKLNGRCLPVMPLEGCLVAQLFWGKVFGSAYFAGMRVLFKRRDAQGFSESSMNIKAFPNFRESKVVRHTDP